MASTIVDQHGNPYLHRRPARAAEGNTGSRPYESVEMKDVGDLVPSWDRKTIVSASRKLYLNEEVLKGAIEQKSMYSVGRAWLPKFQGEDKSWGDKAAKWLSDEWYQLCDIRGNEYDFTTCLYTTSNAIDRDGEGWELLTEDKTGYPRIQQIPAHRVGCTYSTNSGYIKEGPYRNAKIKDGIAYNSLGQPVAASVMSEDDKKEQWVSYRNLIHNFDPSWQEQGRGLPSFTASLNALRDMLQSHEWERHALMMASAIGLIEKNETGGPDLGDPSNLLTGGVEGTAAGTGVTVESFAGGMMKYFRANSGAGIEQLVNSRPGPEWESFHDRIIRAALVGVGWPYSLWKPSGQGTAERNDISKAQLAVEDRQELLKKGARRKVGYAVAKAIKLGILEPNADWWRWDFTMPKKLTIDDGRVSKELIEMWKAGHVNQTDILGAYGKDLKTHLYERAEEIAMRRVVADEVGAKHGVEIEDREMAMLTPNDMSEKETQTTESNGNSDD